MERELVELFDIKKAKLRDEKRLSYEVIEAQKDIKLLILMFRDGIPDVEVDFGEEEKIRWDSKGQNLLYWKAGSYFMIEVATRETIVRIRPHLRELVKKAKEFYCAD